MILSCNSCEKKFVVPDNAIGNSGRLVQCSSCGNKWKQFPIIPESKTKEKAKKIKLVSDNIKKPIKAKKRKARNKAGGPSLYSPEYLSKKHGIKINENPIVKQKKVENKSNVTFGFYNSLVLLIITIIFLLRILYFTQEIIVEKFPISEIYINYLFENIENIIKIIQNFFSGY